MNFLFRFHPKVQIQAEVMTPLHLLKEEAGVFLVGTASARPSPYHMLLTSSPDSSLLRVSPLLEASGFSTLPVDLSEITCEGIRVGYVLKCSWTCVNLFSGLLYVSGSWWETCRKAEIAEGQFPMLFKNSDISVFLAQNKAALVVCGEVTSDLQELLRL